MKIIEINTIQYGSTGKIMRGIASLGSKHGDQILCVSSITSSKKELSNDCEYYYVGTNYTRKFNRALSIITGLNSCFAWFATYKLLKKIETFNPDIIHLHNLHDSYINVPMLFSFIKKRKIPVVWTLHDCWSFTGHCPYFTLANCDKWKTGCFNCPQYKEYPQSLFDNSKFMWNLKKKWFSNIENMTIVTPSLWLADLVKQSFLKDYQIQVINNGIDLDVFKPRKSNFKSKYNLTNEKILLGVAFGWGYRKGLDVFIKLASSLDTSKFRIVLVGTDDKVDSLLPNNIISIHRTNNQKELAEIYSAADVFIIPTREENYPTVNMEAIACGTPVISFKTGGACEMIDDSTGICVDSDNFNSLETAIMTIIENNNLYSEDSCINRAKNFDINKRFEMYFDLYKTILRRNG